MANILIIDDDKMICEGLCDFILPMGHNVECALRLKEGLGKLALNSFDIVFLDVQLPDGNGLRVIPEIRGSISSPEVIIITGEGDPDGAEHAIKSGSWDYLQKSLTLESIELSLLRVLQYREEKTAQKPPVVLKRDGTIGNSARMRFCLDLVAKAGYTDTNVLITGETGTGKELFARAIHDNSSRASESFVIVDCAALPETLVESMLFGHEKGAFTGADRNREGLIKQATGGTLFLDEVGELPMDVQRVFLRVIQERRFRPVGGKQEVNSDFRLIAATNRNPDQMVDEGKFRKDLLFRLRSIVIDLPPLRNRSEDIRNLAFYYMTKFCDRCNIGTKGFSPEFLEAMITYEWPGNVRELINALKGAISVAREEHTLFPIHMPTHIRSELARASVNSKQPDISSLKGSNVNAKTLPNLRLLLETTERQYIEDLMSFTSGDVKESSKISGLSRTRFYERLKKYNINHHA